MSDQTPQEVGIAERIARKAHADQRDLDGQPYIDHVARVVSMVDGDEAKAVAWLHDVLEDSPVTPEDLDAHGISLRVINAVRRLTRTAPREYAPYIDSLRAGQIAARVKVADLRDHLTPNCPDRLRPRYEAAIALLLLDDPVATLTARCEALEQEKTLELETAKIEHTRAILRYTVKGYTAGENADSKHWRERAEAAESRCASLTRVLAQLRDEAMVMDVAYPIIASVLLGEEVADSPALARLSDAEAIITELKAVVREFVHEFKGEDFEAGLWPMMDRANAALAPSSGAAPTQDKEPT